MNPNTLLLRIKTLTWLFIIGLILSGVTAIPLVPEVDALAKAFDTSRSTAITHWLLNVQTALHSINEHYPFLFYGTDWLAFGHFVIAVAFIGALRDPVRNQWLFTFGMISCALVIPYAFIFGAIRGIPVWWRLIDCSFGIFGIVPLAVCKGWAAKLERLEFDATAIRT
jgi:hypothetical protein